MGVVHCCMADDAGCEWLHVRCMHACSTCMHMAVVRGMLHPAMRCVCVDGLAGRCSVRWRQQHAVFRWLQFQFHICSECDCSERFDALIVCGMVAGAMQGWSCVCVRVGCVVVVCMIFVCCVYGHDALLHGG